MLQLFSAPHPFMVITIAFIASVYITGAIILVSELLQDAVWFEGGDGLLHLVGTTRT